MQVRGGQAISRRTRAVCQRAVLSPVDPQQIDYVHDPDFGVDATWLCRWEHQVEVDQRVPDSALC